MLKKTITYEDYNGETRTEDFYFGLNEAELMKKNLRTPGGLEEVINRMMQTKDGSAIIDLFDEVVMQSYGVKAPDGRRFIKSEELSKEFMQTEAYNQLVLELFKGGEEKVAAFVEGILPNKLVTQMKLEEAKREKKEEKESVDGTAKIVD